MITTLYKRSKLGKIQSWAIQVDGECFCTHEGFVGGQITQSEWTRCEGKSLGTKKQTSSSEQALKEAEAKIIKKKEQGYTENSDNVDTAVQKIKPMLAHKYESYDKLAGQTIMVQPKLDGVRCIVTREGLFTRNGKRIVAVPHIEEYTKELLNRISDPNVKLDGELYNHDLKEDFNKIISLVRKTKLTKEDIELSKQLVQYHIYDIDIAGNFYDRHMFLKALLEECLPPIIQVKTHNVISEHALDAWYGQFLIDGYEGQIIRSCDKEYDHSRSNSLLKRKEFMDEEFEIIDIEEGLGNRSGMMGRVKFKMKNGKLFDSNARGTYDYFKELLNNKETYIGKFAIVRFQNYTPDGSVRFPVMIAVRDFE